MGTVSSTYRIICLSHDPALVVEEPEWQGMPDALAGLAAGLPGHPSCELLVGRFSYPLVEVCCPRQHSNGPLHRGFHPHSDEWVDASWLRLVLLAGADVAGRSRLRPCWTYERAHRLRAELLDEAERP